MDAILTAARDIRLYFAIRNPPFPAAIRSFLTKHWVMSAVSGILVSGDEREHEQDLERHASVGYSASSILSPGTAALHNGRPYRRNDYRPDRSSYPRSPGASRRWREGCNRHGRPLCDAVRSQRLGHNHSTSPRISTKHFQGGLTRQRNTPPQTPTPPCIIT